MGVFIILIGFHFDNGQEAEEEAENEGSSPSRGESNSFIRSAIVHLVAIMMMQEGEVKEDSVPFLLLASGLLPLWEGVFVSF